jgi:DDE superfamily endonuclease
LSKDPLFIDKVRDIVGLYLGPLDKAPVLCVDEKSQIQELDRMQPVLPMRPGQVERRTHDYTWHGTTTLLGALDAKSGEIIGEFHQRHRAREFRKFLVTIDVAVPAELAIDLAVVNASTHKTPMIHPWLLRHPRFHVHFTPTSGSWVSYDVSKSAVRSNNMPVIDLTLQHGQTLDEVRRRLEATVNEISARFRSMIQRVDWAADRNRVRLDGVGLWVAMSGMPRRSTGRAIFRCWVSSSVAI